MNKTWKRSIALCLALFFAFGILQIPQYANAAADTDYIQVYDETEQYQMKSRVKVGGYYYWITLTQNFDVGTGYEIGDCKSAKFSILRAKSKKGNGTKIYQSSGVCQKKVNGKKKKVKRYDYLDIYTNGKYVIFGEEDAKTEKITYYRIGVNGKGKKKLATFKNPNFKPETPEQYKGSGIMAIYKNTIYCQVPEKKGLKSNVLGYRIDIKSGKKTRVKALDTTLKKDITVYADGQYLYNVVWAENGKAYDCKSNTQVDTLAAEAYKLGADDSLYGMMNVRENGMITTKVYQLKDNKYDTPVMDMPVSLPEDTKVEFGAVDTEYIYLLYTCFNDGGQSKVYARYNRAADEMEQITSDTFKW